MSSNCSCFELVSSMKSSTKVNILSYTYSRNEFKPVLHIRSAHFTSFDAILKSISIQQLFVYMNLKLLETSILLYKRFVQWMITAGQQYSITWYYAFFILQVEWYLLVLDRLPQSKKIYLILEGNFSCSAAAKRFQWKNNKEPI